MKTIIALFICLFMSQSCFSQTLVAQAKPAGSKEWGYIDASGNFLIEPIYRKCFAFSEEGLAAIYDKKRKEFLFINLKGEVLKTEITGFKLKNVFGFGLKGFEEGLAPIQVGEKWGYMNTEGKVIIRNEYSKVSEFNGGFAAAEKGGKFVILNTKGEEIEIESPGVIDLRHFSEGVATFRTSDKNFGFVNTEGKVVIKSQFKSVGYFSGGLAWAKTGDDQVGFINKTGEWVITPKFEAAKHFNPGSGFARVKLAGKWTFVDKSGKVANLVVADKISNFSEGLCWGKKDDLVGIFDVNGRWVVEPKFQAVRNFSNGYACARQNDKWGFIDKDGNWAVEPKFEGVKDMMLVKQ